MIEFKEFPKIPRLSRDMVITEKLDGTNALIHIEPYDAMIGAPVGEIVETETGRYDFRVGCRTRWINPTDDNYGFARWAYANIQELMKLGAGRHFGEWWGQGIQRNYGLKEKRFSLFNSLKWNDDTIRPGCCHVVPSLYQSTFSTHGADIILEMLKDGGSFAAPGFMKPEGICIYHTASRTYYKKTIEKDESPKSIV